jgi:hypothetical protein
MKKTLDVIRQELNKPMTDGVEAESIDFAFYYGDDPSSSDAATIYRTHENVFILAVNTSKDDVFITDIDELEASMKKDHNFILDSEYNEIETFEPETDDTKIWANLAELISNVEAVHLQAQPGFARLLINSIKTYDRQN